jgi:hypothetical protein
MNEFSFLDVSNFLAPGCSYSSFLKAFETRESKGYFPYDYVNSAEVLEETRLTHYDAFYMKMRNINVLEENYIKVREGLNRAFPRESFEEFVTNKTSVDYLDLAREDKEANKNRRGSTQFIETAVDVYRALKCL